MPLVLTKRTLPKIGVNLDREFDDVRVYVEEGRLQEWIRLQLSVFRSVAAVQTLLLSGQKHVRQL